MAVVSVDKDLDTGTMTVASEHPVPLKDLWDAFLDPRQIERFWGPPTYPARFTRHDGFVGGASAYAMTGPDGDISAGRWDWVALNPYESFEVVDSFAHPDGSLNTDLPAMKMQFQFADLGDGRSRLTNTTFFDDPAQLAEVLEMGMEEGALSAMAQVDAVLTGGEFRPGAPASATILDARRVRVARLLRAGVEDVWRAHHDATLVSSWLLGPDGWSMPECIAPGEVGSAYRYTWRSNDTAEEFGSTGTVLETAPPRREVTTETMAGSGIPEGAPSTTNELTLTPMTAGTLLSIVVTYPDSATRDAVLATGMVEGMETSYARLERALGVG